jgi:hypothetical protein
MQWLSFVGSWLLVVGPLYQAALELRDHEMTGERFSRLASNVPRPDPVSVWWWLVPPVRILLVRSRSQAYLRRLVTELHGEDLRDALGFWEKSVAWLIVAAGATLLATKETLIIVPLPWFAGLGVAALLDLACLGFVIRQLRRRGRLVRRS